MSCPVEYELYSEIYFFGINVIVNVPLLGNLPENNAVCSANNQHWRVYVKERCDSEFHETDIGDK